MRRRFPSTAARVGQGCRGPVAEPRSRGSWFALGTLLTVGGLLVGALSVSGQEPEPEPPQEEGGEPAPPGQEPAPGARLRCTLTWEPATEETQSVSIRDPAGGHVTYVSGGMVWTCGGAVMEADSAVRYEAERRVEMFGDVRYRDTIRTLESDRLDYFQIGDRVVATGDVRLVRLGSGSTLEGPRVEFLRAVSGVAERTVATGRPHMVLRSEDDPDGPPFEVDADRTVFAGEERAAAWGEVVIERPDLRATADSAFFDLEGGEGVLHGAPRAEGERFELAGDTIRLRFRQGDLEDVWALGSGRATGEAFEVLGETVRIRVEDDEVDGVWAFGPERSLAVSPPHRLYGDSLRFFLVAGRLDTIVAVGRAAAVQEEAEEDEVSPIPTAPEEGEASTTPAEDQEEGEAEPTRVGAPRLSLEGEVNWVTGDTLWAIFEPVPDAETPNAAEATDEETSDAAEDGDQEKPDAAELADQEERAPGSPRRDARLQRLRAVGNARAFYAAVRDTTRTTVPSRNYLIGREVEVRFEGGEARRVMGLDAIGIYLDPEPGSPPPVERDTSAVPASETRPEEGSR